MVVGLVLTRERRCFRSRWFWLGGLIALLDLPAEPDLEYSEPFPVSRIAGEYPARRAERDLGPWTFFYEEMRSMLPLTLPIWLGGLWFLFFAEKGKAYRVLGWACVVTFGVIYALNPRVYYLWPACSDLAGGRQRAVGAWLQRPKLAWIKFAYPVLMIAMGAVFAPMLLPVLPVETYIRYAKVLHLDTPAIETVAAWARCRRFMRRNLAGRRWWRRLPESTSACRRRSGRRRPSSGRTMGRREPSICSGRSMDCPTPSADIRTISCGVRAEYTGESVIVMEGTEGNAGAESYASCGEAGARVASVLDAKGSIRCLLLSRAEDALRSCGPR